MSALRKMRVQERVASQSAQRLIWGAKVAGRIRIHRDLLRRIQAERDLNPEEGKLCMASLV